MMLRQLNVFVIYSRHIVGKENRYPPRLNNNNNNNHDDIYSAVIYGASHMREFTVVHLGQSRSAPGGRQLAGQAANLTFESACRLPFEHSPIATGIITQP